MEKAESLREIALGVIPQMANFFGFWLRSQNVVSPIGEISSIPEDVHFPSRNPWDRHPKCSKIATQRLINVPLYRCHSPAQRTSTRRPCCGTLGMFL